MSALRPLRANVPARKNHAFAATTGDNTAMRPFAKLLWTLVSVNDGLICLLGS